MTTHLALWSGPRNISTAMMRAFDSRADCWVSDEPLYAAYLRATGLAHPHADEIIQTHEANWRKVVAHLAGPVPSGHSLWYQKHMAHHLLDDMDRDWLDGLTNAFLIREPRAMLTSLLEKLDQVRLEDTGLPQQVELFRWQAERTGETPVVIDAKEVLLDPRGVLDQLCARVGIGFDTAMLSWAAGPRDTDGCWGPYWYHNTNNSTSFAPYREKQVAVPVEHEELAQQAEALYFELHPHRLLASTTDPS